jgi:PAS domain S-box-containing protein
MSQGEFMGMGLNHVLIADPDETVRARVRHLLAQAKIAALQVSEAETAENALQACSANGEARPGLILLAIELAGKRGDEWFARARGVNSTLNIPIILLGEDEEDDRMDAALAAGASGYLLLSELNARRIGRMLRSTFARHQAIQETEASVYTFREFIDSTPALVWAADETKQRNFFNKVWLDYTGRTLEDEQGMGWLEDFHPDDREASFQNYSQAFDRREPFTMEYRLRRHDGEYRWILAQGQPRYDAAGKFLGYIGSCLDITGHKESEEESLLNEERLRVVLNGSPITVMTVDRDLRYTWIHNAQGGLTAEQMLGKRDDELFPPQIAQDYIDFKREVIDKGIPVHRQLDFAWGGEVARYDTRGEPLRDAEGQIVGLTIVTINITDRVREEERTKFLAAASQLLASSLDYETTLQGVMSSMVPHLADWCSIDLLAEDNKIEQVAVAHVDPDKVKWAKQWREHNPSSLDDEGGLALVLRTGKSEFYPYLPPELLEEALRNAPSEEHREAIRSINFKSVIIVPLITREKVLGAITLVWSDSDRHYDEADLAFAEELARRAATAVDHAHLYRESQIRAEDFRLLNEQLEQLVDERTKELQRSNQDLDQFAYIASHDLKAPLRAIDHLSTWVMEDVGHLLPERSHEHLEKMRSRIKRMEGLLDDLLTYSRAGRFRGEAALVDTDELVARVVETVSPPDGFVVSVEGDLPEIYTYAAPLETVLRNLVNNAIKHHNKPQGHITISASNADDMVEFAVADDGPGIDPAFHDRIFQMFQTLRPRDQVEGSGIGLAVVEKIIDNVGGTIGVDSVPGKGATFRFTWPRQVEP